MRKSSWCPGAKSVTRRFEMGDRPRARKVRCPRCGKQLMERIRACNMSERCWHPEIPPHKTTKRIVEKGKLR